MKDFEQRSDDAQELTATLVVFFSLATLVTVVLSSFIFASILVGASYLHLSIFTTIEMPQGYWYQRLIERFLQVGIVTGLALVATIIHKLMELSEHGGWAIARSLHGTRVSELTTSQEQRMLLHVVEEMAIAATVPKPAVYVLEQEQGINAFAAGVDPQRATVMVTQGALERLNRQQLQGVIAHEFSHVVRGDMRLNSRIVAIMSGIQAIAFVANFLIRLGTAGKGKPPRGPSLGGLLGLVLGCSLWPVGQIGTLAAMLLSMAINRQREFLADATAVKFTRNPQGLIEALQILQRDEMSSHLSTSAMLVASHMCFAVSGRGWSQLLKTHPALDERIARLRG